MEKNVHHRPPLRRSRSVNVMKGFSKLFRKHKQSSSVDSCECRGSARSPTSTGSTQLQQASWGCSHTPSSSHCSTPHLTRSVSVSNYSTPRTISQEDHWGPPSLHESSCCSSHGPKRGVDVFLLYAVPHEHGHIDVRSEAELLGESLSSSSVPVRVNVGVATGTSFTKLLTLARRRPGVVIHLSAHAVYRADTGVGLVLEDSRGMNHVLWRSQLEELLLHKDEGLQNIGLLFLSTCHSEELAQLFVECGCRHVVAVKTDAVVNDSVARQFSQQFYLELACGGSIFEAWEGARRAIKVDPNPDSAAQADSFVLYGQRSASKTTFEMLCDEETHVDECGGPLRDFETLDAFLEFKVPSQIEFFVDRRRLATFTEVLSRRDRRAFAIHGPPGIGKSSLAVELARFVSMPGRSFSRSTIYLHVDSMDMWKIAAALEDQLATLQEELQVPMRTRSGSSWSSAGTPRSLSNQSLNSMETSEVAEDDFAALMPVRYRICRDFERIERHRPRPILLIIDDEAGAVRDMAAARRLLGELLDNTQRVRLLICSEGAIYNTLSSRKVHNVPLPRLQDCYAANLLLRRIHRPLNDNDWPSAGNLAHLESGNTGLGATPRKPTESVEKSVRRLCGPPLHPLLKKLEGHPGNIVAMSSRVVPQGPSLYELANAEC